MNERADRAANSEAGVPTSVPRGRAVLARVGDAVQQPRLSVLRDVPDAQLHRVAHVCSHSACERLRVCLHARTAAQAHAHTHTRTHAYTHTHTHAHTRTSTRTCAHAHTARARTYECTHAHAHTCATSWMHPA
jgi:hypothetical protein